MVHFLSFKADICNLNVTVNVTHFKYQQKQKFKSNQIKNCFILLLIKNMYRGIKGKTQRGRGRGRRGTERKKS